MGRTAFFVGLGLALAGCGAGYRAGTLIEEAPSGAWAARSECLDVQLVRVTDRAVTDGRPVVAYRVGNRCLHPVRVDLSAVEARGDVDGLLVTLDAYDPRGEIRAASLDGRTLLEEWVAYEPPSVGVTVGRVCLSVGGVAAGVPDAPVCLDPAPSSEEEDTAWDG